MKDTVTGEDGFIPLNSTGTVFIRIAVPELKVQKCLQFQLEHTVWQAKQRVLTAFAKDLRDAINYGMYLPPSNGRAGKFMEEERLLSEYPIQGPIGFLEFKYKRRVYKMMQINERKLKQIHAKSKLKLFLELVRAGNSDKINKMTAKGLDPNFHDQDNGETPLTIAVTLGKSKCREIIITLVSGGSHLDFRNRQGLTALHRAAIVGNAEAIRTLLDLGASPDCKDSRDLTPLYYSVSNDDAVQDCTHMLLHERARVGICDEHGWYEIHQACKYGRVQHLEHLLFYGVEMDVRNSCGNTPLHVCALNNQEACARVLLFRGADPTLLNYNNQTADQVAGMAGNNAIADMINAHNPDDVVPYREIPQYSNRRKGMSLTPSLRALLRSRSDPRINLAGVDNSRSPSNFSSPYGGQANRRHNGGIGGIDSDSACSISVSSAGSVTGVTDQGMYEGRTAAGREGYFPGGHLSQVNMRRAGSLGDVNNVSRAANHRNTLATLTRVDREQLPRVVLLHRSSEGYGFVLRGAKSKIPTGGGFNDFTPTAEYPALQYLDSVDPGSQADRAGLKGGDFILEINGENVIRASHEHVVHLIRSSSDVLTLKVVTVSPTDRTPADWFLHSDSGAMTLPTRKKQAAPLPPQRDPRTSLSYSKASSKSMTEGLAEIEKLDAAIAEFEGQEAVRRHSLHGLQAADDPKVASVRASHTVKRVSVVDYDGLMSGEPNPSAKDSRQARDYMSPAEARIKKYHKKPSPQTMERSKSTPDIVSAIDQGYAGGHYAMSGIATGGGLGGKISGPMTKTRAPPPPPQGAIYSGALQTSPTTDSSRLIGAVAGGSGPYQRNRSNPSTPELPDRRPMNHRGPPSAPQTPEVVRIHTGGKSSSNYANVSAEIQNRSKMESFTDNPKGSPEQPILKNKKGPSNQNLDKSISFADDRVMENAQKFIQKYPNATLLVTADIHSGKANDKKASSSKEVLYEPEPDYDDSDEDRSTPGKVTHINNGSSTVTLTNSTPTPLTAVARDNRTGETSNSVVRQNRSSVTVISITSDANRTNKPVAQKSSGIQENASWTSPTQSMSSSRGSSGVIMATSSSQPSSTEGSRRSSVQSNMSGESGDKNVRVTSTTSTSGISISKSDSSFNGSSAPPPPPPGPPPPPPPPLPSGLGASPSTSANSTLRRPKENNHAASVLPNRVSTEDILAAVAERKSRIQTDGARLTEVKPALSKSTHDLNQEALKAAVAKRKSRIEQGEDKSMVSEIEARLQRNKKLQAAKFFGSDVNRNYGENKEVPKANITPPAEPKPAVVSAPSENKVESSALKPSEIAARFEPGKSVSQVKLSPTPPVKASVSSSTANKSPTPIKSNQPAASETTNTIDFRARLKPVDVKANASPVAIQSKATSSSGSDTTTSTAVSKTPSNVSTIVMSKTNSNKAPAPSPPTPKTTATNVSATKITSSEAKPKTELPSLITSKNMGSSSQSVSLKPASTAPAPAATSPSSTTTPTSSADYIALAEKARQEYLKKKASGNLTPHIEKKGPVEITPNKKNTPKSPTSPSGTAAGSPKPNGHTLIEVKPAQNKGEPVKVSGQSRLKTVQTDKDLPNGKMNVALRGVTEDHSHTEQSLSNGTMKKKSNGSASPPPNLITPPPDKFTSLVTPPPPGFGDRDVNSSSSKGVVIDILPPPTSFGSTDDSQELPPPPFSHDDTASFVSSVSSLSTLSSEQGEGNQQDKPNMNIEDMIAPPPPPPDFGDTSLGDQDTFIPPPPEFLEIDSNANESKAMDKNSKPFAGKSVSNWSCMDVLDWLDSLGLPQYRVSFAKACVDGSKLVDMGRNEFINLGVTQVGHRMNLERSVKKLNLGASTNL